MFNFNSIQNGEFFHIKKNDIALAEFEKYSSRMCFTFLLLMPSLII